MPGQRKSGIRSLGTKFRYNRVITKVKELHYFTRLTSIADSAFRECSNLSEIDIPDFIKSIERMAFQSNNLANVVLPASVASLGDSSFRRNDNTRVIMQTCTLLRNSVVTIFGNTFSGQTTTQFYVPSELVDSYKAATNWSSLASRIHAIED